MKARKYTINGIDYEVAVNSLAGDNAEVTVNGVTYQVKIGSSEEDMPRTAAGDPDTSCPAPAATAPEVAQTGAGKAVVSPLPGVIVGIKVKVGDVIKDGQVVAILEAMKMENEIQSEYSGTVTSINVSTGDSILEGTPIVTIE